MNYVYVLASSKDDLYYEQFYLSSFSLRLFNSNANIILLVDEKTKKGLTGKRTEYEKITSETKVISPPLGLNQKEASRWIKTSIPDYVSGDFLFIDCDTIITGLLDDIFSKDIILGAVLDTHILLSEHHLKKTFQRDNEKLGFSVSSKCDYYFNGGLLFCRDHKLTKDFFAKWHFLWNKSYKMGNSQDMPSLNQANYEFNNIITELPGEWNCQISHNGLPYLHNAKIIHYYATSLTSFIPAYRLASPEILASIKITGEIPGEAMMLLENPRAAFETRSRIVADPAVLGAFDSYLFSKLIDFNKKHRKLFKKCDTFMANCAKIIKKIIGKKQ
jgi:hypothetical protein